MTLGTSETVKVSAGPRETPAQEPESTIATFSNPALITINDNSTASPYPSTITVSGVNPAYMYNLRVTLMGLTHTFPDDIDIMLVGPQGQRSMLMSDAGGGGDVNFITLGFEQAAVNAIPDETQLTGGLFRPANYTDTPADNFPTLVPPASTMEPADLSVFNGTDPNGDWKLYIVDDAANDTGFISTGWQLRFTVPAAYTVTKTADTNDGVCDADCSLREAIAAAPDGELVNFSSLFNTPQTITLSGTELLINKSLYIQGPGANLLTVTANSASRVFNIAPAIVYLGGMTITGGSLGSFSQGGGIDNNGDLTVSRCVITGNTAAFGGGLHNANAISLFDSTISNNTATASNGISSGGGIYNNGTLTVTNSTISDNVAADTGGIRTNGVLTMTNSIISGNTAGSGGGGILNSGGFTLTLTNSTISGNTVTEFGFGLGGGIVNFGNLTVSNSTISGNHVLNGDNSGGGILSDLGNAIIINSTITNNSAAGAASASGLFRDGATVTIRNSIIAANQNNATQPDVVATGNTGIASNGFNLIGNPGTVVFGGAHDQFGSATSPLNPLLAGLVNNGGPTRTHALLPGSPALDQGDNTGSGQTTDQRGFTRTVDLPETNAGDGTDIGAYEAFTAPVQMATQFGITAPANVASGARV